MIGGRGVSATAGPRIQGPSGELLANEVDTLRLGSGISVTINGLIASLDASGGGSGVTSFETVSKNLAAYPSALGYTAGYLTSITYAVGASTIVKTLTYDGGGALSLVILSGAALPAGILTTKTLSYDGAGNLVGVSYS